MANNRMVLVCNRCNPYPGEWNYDGKVFVIAKWYPGSAFYSNREDNDSLNQWLEEHFHHDPVPVRLEYERPDLKDDPR